MGGRVVDQSVARPTRAWIETSDDSPAHGREWDVVARPTRAWIETFCVAPLRCSRSVVARPTRAWIETISFTSDSLKQAVARPTRAWIETVKWSDENSRFFSVARPTRAWIETLRTGELCRYRMSPAPRGRGLKLFRMRPLRHRRGSPAPRGRGLKPGVYSAESYDVLVARPTRAWIETWMMPHVDDPGIVARPTRAWIETSQGANELRR